MGGNPFHSLAIIICLLLTLTAVGCKPHKDWQLYDISGHMPDLQFSLTADDGRAVTEKDYKDQTVLLYFGFTSCPDECPLMMGRLAAVLKKMGPEANKLRVLFVSIDSKRDTVSVLHRYMEAFDPKHMTGLTGSRNDVYALAKRYRVAVDDKGGEITHSSALFVFDGTWTARLLMTPDDTDQALIHDLQMLP